MSFIKEHYDAKNDQLLFYPKLRKSKATQPKKQWKDADEHIEEEGSISVPNSSTFVSNHWYYIYNKSLCAYLYSQCVNSGLGFVEAWGSEKHIRSFIASKTKVISLVILSLVSKLSHLSIFWIQGHWLDKSFRSKGKCHIFHVIWTL